MAGNRAKKILAIDWDDRNLRIVDATVSKRGVGIDRILSVAIPRDVDPASPEAMGAVIRKALDQEGITTRHAIVDIPRDQAILKTLALPPADAETMAGIVRIQIAKELPFPVDDAVVDFAMEASEDGAAKREGAASTVDVLVAAVRQELRDQYVATFHAAGLKLDRIGLRPFANKLAVCRLLEFGGLPERVLVIDVRPNLTEIDVLKGGALAFSRAASVVVPEDLHEAREALPRDDDETPPAGPRLTLTGLSEGEEAEEEGGSSTSAGGASRKKGPVASLIEAILLEVRRSIEAYRAGDPGARLDHAVIGGDVGIEERLAEAIQSRLHITAELYNPASLFGWDPDEGAAASAFSATVGLVLGHAETGSLQFDFLHPKRPGESARKRLKKAPLAAAAVVLFVTACAVGLTQYRKEDRAILARIQQRIAELEDRRSENRKFEKLMRELRAFDEEQHVWVDVLYELFSNLPPNKELVVDRVELQQDQGRVVLKTRTKQRDTPLEVIRSLDAYRRPGRDQPRFKATMGPQSEKKGEEYPFVQDLRVFVLKDASPRKEGNRGR